MIKYDSKEGLVCVSGHEDLELYCGKNLDEIATLLIQLKTGKRTLQQTYIDLMMKLPYSYE